MCQFFSVFACLLNGETLIFEIKKVKKTKKKLVFGLQLWSILRYFGFFSVFIQFLFFVRSISGDNYVRYIVQQEVWSACFQREPWFASQKESPLDLEGFTFCASVVFLILYLRGGYFDMVGIISTRTVVRFPKESPLDWEGFIFCAI